MNGHKKKTFEDYWNYEIGEQKKKRCVAMSNNEYPLNAVEISTQKMKEMDFLLFILLMLLCIYSTITHKFTACTLLIDFFLLFLLGICVCTRRTIIGDFSARLSIRLPLRYCWLLENLARQ